MGQKTHPIGFRLGVIKGWDSNWYDEQDVQAKLVEDEEIRRYLGARLERAGLSRAVIERTPKRVILTLHTSLPPRPMTTPGREVCNVKMTRLGVRSITARERPARSRRAPR